MRIQFYGISYCKIIIAVRTKRLIRRAKFGKRAPALPDGGFPRAQVPSELRFVLDVVEELAFSSGVYINKVFTSQ